MPDLSNRPFYTLWEAFDLLGRIMFPDDWAKLPDTKPEPGSSAYLERTRAWESQQPLAKASKESVEEALGNFLIGGVASWIVDRKTGLPHEIPGPHWDRRDIFGADIRTGLAGYRGGRQPESGELRIDQKKFDAALVSIGGGLTNEDRRRGGKKPKYDKGLQAVIDQIELRFRNDNQKLTLTNLKAWVLETASETEPLEFSVPDCDWVFFDAENELLRWTNGRGQNRDKALRSLERYIVRARGRKIAKFE